MGLEIEIVDDSGLLGLVDAATYATFVGADWTYEQLMAHFAAQMQRAALLVWDCGDGGSSYRLRIRNDGFSSATGFREITGHIVVSSSQLHVASYTALTMAAQFPKYGIPDKHETDLTVDLAPGSYQVRLVQMYDPDDFEQADNPPFGIHFLLEFRPGDGPAWKHVAWHPAAE
jgi:hypothetical protein